MVAFVPDLYKILNIPPDSNEEEIKSAFRMKARSIHPDKKGKRFTSKFQNLMQWQDTLLDADKRKKYDERLTKYKVSQTDDPNWIINLNLGGNGNSSDNITTDGDSGVDDSAKVTPTGNQSSKRRSGGGKEKVVHDISSDSDSDQDAPKIVEPGPIVEGRSKSSTDKSRTDESPMEVENESPRERAEEQGKWTIKLSPIISR